MGRPLWQDPDQACGRPVRPSSRSPAHQSVPSPHRPSQPDRGAIRHPAASAREFRERRLRMLQASQREDANDILPPAGDRNSGLPPAIPLGEDVLNDLGRPYDGRLAGLADYGLGSGQEQPNWVRESATQVPPSPHLLGYRAGIQDALRARDYQGGPIRELQYERLYRIMQGMDPVDNNPSPAVDVGRAGSAFGHATDEMDDSDTLRGTRQVGIERSLAGSRGHVPSRGRYHPRHGEAQRAGIPDDLDDMRSTLPIVSGLPGEFHGAYRHYGSRRGQSLGNIRRARRGMHRGRHDLGGLGDRDRSVSPEGDEEMWDTLQATVTPDPHPPSVGSSFVSTTASTSASQGPTGLSSHTPITSPGEEAEPPCDPVNDQDSHTEGGEDVDAQGPREDRPQRPAPYDGRSYAEVATNASSDITVLPSAPEWLELMHLIVRGLAHRDDIPDEWWAQAGLNRM
ncbi:hypothetical protein F4677DRAFT_438222 [Hypoxylon crocopeplum]|nr:hypothetical protein F4677DRAFT_438222 [Hypoxylon crocopeplum]